MKALKILGTLLIIAGFIVVLGDMETSPVLNFLVTKAAGFGILYLGGKAVATALDDEEKKQTSK